MTSDMELYGWASGAAVRSIIPATLNGAYHGVVDGMHVDALKAAGVQLVASAAGQGLATMIPAPDSIKKPEEAELYREALGSVMAGVLYSGGKWALGHDHLVKNFLVGAILDAAAIPVWMWSMELAGKKPKTEKVPAGAAAIEH